MKVFITYSLTYSLTHLLTYSLTHLLTYSLTFLSRLFICIHLINLSEDWLWQYWRPEHRPSQANKKLMYYFDSKIRKQKKLKTLIRNGIPPELRGQIWYISLFIIRHKYTSLIINKVELFRSRNKKKECKIL